MLDEAVQVRGRGDSRKVVKGCAWGPHPLYIAHAQMEPRLIEKLSALCKLVMGARMLRNLIRRRSKVLALTRATVHTVTVRYALERGGCLSPPLDTPLRGECLSRRRGVQRQRENAELLRQKHREIGSISLTATIL